MRLSRRILAASTALAALMLCGCGHKAVLTTPDSEAPKGAMRAGAVGTAPGGAPPPQSAQPTQSAGQPQSAAPSSM